MHDAYHYMGVKDGWHVFECIKRDFDKEILLLERARMVMEDGSSVFYDPVLPSSQLSFDMEGEEIRRNRRIGAYAKAISKSASVKPVHRRGHIPKEVTPDLTTRSRKFG